MRCFVTGASGFVGANLAHELVARGHEVRALLRPESDRRGIKGLAFEPVSGDVSDPQRHEKQATVLDVLEEIGAGDHRRFTVYNKLDLLGAQDPLPFLKSDEFLVSAVTGEGLPELVERIVAEVTVRSEASQT